MKAKVTKTGEIVDVYHEPQHGQALNIYKESVFINGGMWQENELEFIESKEVDLEKVFNDEYSKFSNDTDAMDYAFPIDLADFRDFAKYFFELGFKVKQEFNDEVKVGETQIYFNDSREQPYVRKGLDLSCMKYETLKTLFNDGDNVEILIRKA